MSDLFAQLLAGDGVLVLERVDAKQFVARGAVPAWVARLVPPAELADATREPGRVFHFLDHFLDDAEAWWRQPEGVKITSAPWTEEGTQGEVLHLEASAWVLEQKAYLLVRSLEGEFARTHRVLQVGRELALAHERLLSEISKKEILLHCIVHDLNGPLSGILGAFDLLRNETLSATGRKFVELGKQAAQQQAHFISDMLDTFRTEVGSIDTLPTDPAALPDVLAAAQEVIEALAPAAEIREVDVRLELALGTPGIVRVMGERNRLERLFHNLLQNALRYSPRQSGITVTVQRNEADVLVTVDDNGPGVPAEVVPQLFQKFVRGKGLAGKAGLGLYFCRITVELWGGEIGCSPRAEGGTRFWFRLKAA